MKKKIVAVLCVATLAMSVFAGCGSDSGKKADENKTTQESQQQESEAVDDAGDTEAAFDAETALKALLDENPAADNFLVLSGVTGGWAPTVMVLDKDGNFTCLVDYAGQAVVNFATGTYTENADGTITATGTQYDTGEALEYTITVADGTYTVIMPVPSTEAEGTLTGTK